MFAFFSLPKPGSLKGACTSNHTHDSVKLLPNLQKTRSENNWKRIGSGLKKKFLKKKMSRKSRVMKSTIR